MTGMTALYTHRQSSEATGDASPKLPTDQIARSLGKMGW
jgi:hypothetical protein